MKRILIYFGDEQQKQPIVEQVLKDMHADYRILQDADLNQCVANLMGLPGFDEIPDAKPAHYSIDLMLFEDASDEEIQKVNECLQAKGTAMQRKAMLTKHNKAGLSMICFQRSNGAYLFSNHGCHSHPACPKQRAE